MDSALQQHFGFPAFRRGQREGCEAALANRDLLVVMPTGSGKSLCYQLPALMRDDLTLVVSPLVSLMQDQVEALGRRGHGAQVALFNSQQDPSLNADALARAEAGSLRLLYVAPERFASPGFLDRMKAVRVGLFVVDEAHCVSQWGHDFRPDYLRLADAARIVGASALVASTATATPQVSADVVRRLGLRDPVRVVTGFDRPNMSFTVARPAGHEKRRLMGALLSEPDALPAIVYAGTRAGAEEQAEFLSRELGVEALPYHAGLERGRRAEVQRRFLADEVPLIVATNAFGMGVDKPNVRTVLHASTPSSLEAYYQEAGRAGRDGRPARAVLLAEGRDKALHVHFIKRDEVSPDVARALAERIAWAADQDGRFAEDSRSLARSLGVSDDSLRALVGHLARAGAFEVLPSAPDQVRGIAKPWDGKVAGLLRSAIADAERARWRQYREIWAYVEGESCRRRAILQHFGDRAAPSPEVPCCDVCDLSLALVAPPPDPVVLEGIDDAIISVARIAKPSVGRNLCAEILHGAKTKKIARNSYDGLPAYGLGSDMRRADIVHRIDELVEEGRLRLTRGPYPVLELPPA